MSVVLQTGVMYYRENEQDTWHPLILKADTDLSSLVEKYNAASTTAIVAGELRLHDAKVYCAKADITMPKAWTASDWDETTLGAEIGDLKDSLGHTDEGLAYIVDGDTCTTAVPSKAYAYIKNNTHSLAEGLYRNKSANAFPTSGGTADGTVFESVSGGGLNDLKNSLSYKKTIIETTPYGSYVDMTDSTLVGKTVVHVNGLTAGDADNPYEMFHWGFDPSSGHLCGYVTDITNGAYVNLSGQNKRFRVTYFD